MRRKKMTMRRVALFLAACIVMEANPPIASAGEINPAGRPWIESDSNAIPATASSALLSMRASVTGDLWAGWTGDMRFLDGNHGRGTAEQPYQISTKEELMGLSEMAARGMTASAGRGEYVGDYSDAYFRLTRDIDLGGMTWMPIGFYQNEPEISGEIAHAFSAHFDGGNHTIKNFRMYHPTWRNVGFFGALSGAEVKNLTIRPGGLYTVKENGGLLAGVAENSSIKNVTVSGRIVANGTIGGIAGVLSASVAENCVSDHVSMDATTGPELFVGGVAGKAETSIIVDCAVFAGDSSGASLQGTGYVGGITGFQNDTDIFNAVVSGTIGGAGSLAAGGFSGLYASGQIKVGQFSGKISGSGLGSLSREGTFIGTRDTANYFTFGPDGDLAYLYADAEKKITADICGSGIQEDNRYTYDAHIGYWHAGDRHYSLVQGQNTRDVEDTCFYEELENGILSVIDSSGGKADRYEPDHYAPDDNGKPVRGRLLIVNQIDTVAGGDYFYDVATLTAAGASRYDRQLSKERRGAVRPGAEVTVSTAPKNTETEKFQMEGSPYYLDAQGKKTKAAYQTGGAYTFRMPDCDTQLNADYKKVAAAVSVKQKEYAFRVIQTRTGNRKTPDLKTEVRDRTGKLIATYINHSLAAGTTVFPVKIEAVVDANNDVADGRVKWEIDDAQLIHLKRNGDEDGEGYTAKSADIELNLDAEFFSGIVAKLEKEQADLGYRYKIPDTIYGAGHESGGVAVLTARTRPAASFEGKSLTANCKIQVTFQIKDQTQVATEGASLNKTALTYTITRRLSGDRKNPEEAMEVTAPQTLTAAFLPDHFDKKNISWSVDDDAVIRVTAGGYAGEGADGDYRSASVRALRDTKWIQDILASDAGIHENDPYARLFGSGERSARVTVKADDTLGNIRTASCDVLVNFVTEDDTVIIPEGARLEQSQATYNLSCMKAGDMQSQTVGTEGFGKKSLRANVLPVLSAGAAHEPYDRSVIWTSSDPAALTVSQDGIIEPVEDAEWIQEAMKKAPYQAEKRVLVTASAKGNPVETASCEVLLSFAAQTVELDREAAAFDMVVKRFGPRGEKTLVWDGMKAQKLEASVFPKSRVVGWTSSAPELLTVGRDGEITPVKNAEWIREAMEKAPYEAEKDVVVTAAATINGRTMTDACKVSMKFRVETLEFDEEEWKAALVLTKTGPKSRPALTWSGNEPRALTASVFGKQPDKQTITYDYDKTMFVMGEDGSFTVNTDAPWIEEAIKNGSHETAAEGIISAACSGGELYDTCKVSVTCEIIDKTYAAGGGSGGGSSGGGVGSPSSGITISGTTKKIVEAPAGSVTGIWIQDGAGNWIFTSGGRTYADEWAFIHNPYAAENQESTSWFRFHADGHLIVGWYQSAESGSWYYLNPAVDGTLGQMKTGWQWIDGKCYFFESSGRLFAGGRTPDGYTVNERGEWTVNGTVQMRKD